MNCCEARKPVLSPSTVIYTFLKRQTYREVKGFIRNIGLSVETIPKTNPRRLALIAFSGVYAFFG